MVTKSPLHTLFFTTFLVSVPLQLSYHFWPEWTMVLGRKVDYLSPTIYLSDIFLTLCVVTWGFSHRNNLVSNSLHFLRKNRSVVILLSLFFTLILLTSSHLLLSVVGIIKILELMLLCLYIYKNWVSPLFITKILITTSVAVVCLSVMQMNRAGSLGGGLWLLGERSFTISSPNIAKTFICIPNTQTCSFILRPYATFPHPNVLAGYLGVTTLATLIYAKKIRFAKIYIAIFIVGMILSGSRTAALSLLLVTGLYFLKKFANPFSFRFIFLGTFFLLSVASFCLTFIFSPGIQNLINTQESLLIRQQLNQASLQVFWDHTLFGTGYNTFLTQLPHYLVYKTVYFLQPVHNIYFLLLSTLGLVGVGFLTSIAWLIVKKINKNTTIWPLILPLLFLLYVGFFDHYPITLQQGQLLLALTLSFIFTQKSLV
jgi:O-antigen ligase